ncbi:PilZ domain-containing protein [Desulfovibrio sp. OttesenSCG-928-A18]|nr:PilZ domain-containing protein [Desulfovibrio sp. OttesenSCG-928-A18]
MDVQQQHTQDNKRRYLRLPRPYRVQARELVFPIAKDPLIDTPCNDISKGGLCVESRSPLPVGTRLHVSVHIPLLNKFSSTFFKVYENDAEQYFQAIADVAWVKSSGGSHLMGLQFVNADEDLCTALGKLIDEAFRKLSS